MLYLGRHLSLKAPDYYFETIKTAINLNINCFMFYTGSPQSLKRVPLSQYQISSGRTLLKKSVINENKIVIHAPYVINIANPHHNEIISVTFLKEELRRAQEFHVGIIILHPGSSVDVSEEVALKTAIKILNLVFDNDQTQVKIALETMSGKGNELGKNLLQLQKIINGVKKNNRVGICIDTCHLHDAGYNLNNFDHFLDDFDHLIGLSKLLVLHINDSLSERGSHKDRHANIGFGKIGFKTLYQIVHNPRLKEQPKILETPLLNDFQQLKNEINMLK